ncbi:MAG: nickel pincer cofactor biosynthesis protein LarB [Ignavibacteriae bacterium]|nr:MAG: nickel pincer cofactor biosynthesis protein LarB [Ignavibacteriota bacterium]
MKDKHYIEMGFAKYDLKREKIKGFPEVILALGKDEKHLTEIVVKAIKRTKKLLITRVIPEQYAAIKKALAKSKIKIKYYKIANLIYIGEEDKNRIGKITVVCAGTADVPVAEEAALCCEFFGSNVERLYDVGVAGIHRLLNNADVFEGCNSVIVAAGMDGALPSVVGGLISCPLIAVPTSVGYGASFRGLAALLTMLNSCSVGMSVVNIDNGFGAAYQAHLINKMVCK